MQNLPNFTSELAQLLKFAGDTATAIRMYSAYSGSRPSMAGKQPRDESVVPVDLMFLSDAVSQMLEVGGSIERGDLALIASKCLYLERLFESYAIDNPQYEPQAKPTFDYWHGLVNLNVAIGALKGIQQKALAIGETS